MPFLVQDLLVGRGEPTSVRPQDSGQRALELMVENNYSQLPVVDDYMKPLGMITGDNLLRNSAFLELAPQELSVGQVYEKLDRYYPADLEINDILNGLNQYPAVLVVNKDGILLGIVTNWDTADYFRRRAVDSMLIQDIETLLKDHIRSAFANSHGISAANTLEAIIDEVSDEPRFKVIKSGVKSLLNAAALNRFDPDDEAIRTAFAKALAVSKSGKTLDDLTLYELSTVLLHKSTWQTVNKYLTIPEKNLRTLLDAVRDTRNAVAHSKREITEWERKRLRQLISILQDKFPAPSIDDNASEELADDSDSFMPEIEDPINNDSMYAPLAEILRSQPAASTRIQFSFTEIEEELGIGLPQSAREHRSWWANDSVSHVQSRQWLSAGWKQSGVNMSNEVVTFTRYEEREEAYITFFSVLLTDLRASADFKVHDGWLNGSPWTVAYVMPADGKKKAFLNYAFTKGKKFRVELYIDTEDADQNSFIYDRLLDQKDAIEGELGTVLTWEPLLGKRACRVALYHDGSIKDSEPKQVELRQWAVTALIQLERVIAARTLDALRSMP